MARTNPLPHPNHMRDKVRESLAALASYDADLVDRARFRNSPIRDLMYPVTLLRKSVEYEDRATRQQERVMSVAKVLRSEAEGANTHVRLGWRLEEESECRFS